MPITLPFGLDARWTLNTTGRKLSRLGPTPDPEPLPDPASSVRKALGAPLDYPPLTSATVPGDQVVVTIPAGLPALEPLAWGILQAILDAGVEPEHLVLLAANKVTETSLSACLQAHMAKNPWIHEIRIRRHHPHDDDSCGLIGVTHSGHPVRMNRLIVEADLVLPIGLVSTAVDTCNDKPPLLSGLYPDFSDQETMNSFYAPSSRDNGVHRVRRRKESEDATRLLAGGLVVQIVPAAQDQVATLFAGQPASVATAAWKACLATWTPTLQSRGDLAICLLTGTAATQSWSGIGHALQAANTVLDADGCVVLCSELRQPPGPSLGRLCQQDDRASRQHEIMRDREADSWTALQLSRTLQRGPVYLQSQLDKNVVESLGMTPITSEKELTRLVASRTHSIILDDAQWLAPQVR